MSKLASIAKVVYNAKVAAARSAPAAIVGPLQNIFCPAAKQQEEEVEEKQQQQQEEVLLESIDESILSELAQTVTNSARLAATANTPIENPFAKQELRAFQQDYYRRQVVVPAHQQRTDYVENPDLSVPVGEEYLYLAQ